jgi:LysR family transcriptional regulator, benzoate and cis,cis-muconate-responsive activator of ben and cat genes
MELRQLKYFAKVAELEHFGQASEQLNVVQPALSRQVKQLEDELDVQLFERLPRGVRLTAAGRVLLERASALLAEVDSITSDVKRAGAGKLGKLRVAFADGATYSGHVPQIIASFRASHPDVHLELVPATSLEQNRLLKAGLIDIAFVYWISQDANDLQSRDLNAEKIMLAAAKSNPLSLKKVLVMRDLIDSRFVWFKREISPIYFDLVLSRCANAGVTLNVVQEAVGESTILTLVSTDIGVTFMTESARGRKPDNVELIQVKDLDITITLKCLWRKNDRNAALIEFLKIVRP